MRARTLIVLVVVGWLPGPASAQETAAFFKQTCSSCHTIGGGKLAGPDLKNVTQRKDREWLKQFIINPKAVLDSGDAYAQKLKQEFNSEMPNLNVSPQRAEALLDLIEAESKLPQSQFKGVQVSDRPLTPADVAAGEEIFLGVRPLAKGGAACISCHNVAGTPALGGGQLGPDLTHVYGKMKTRNQFVAWLSAPATPTMLPVYKEHPLEPEEILALVAYFQEADRGGAAQAPADATGPTLTFVLLGLGGAALGLVAFDFAWRRRFRGVRRDLVHGNHVAR